MSLRPVKNEYNSCRPSCRLVLIPCDTLPYHIQYKTFIFCEVFKLSFLWFLNNQADVILFELGVIFEIVLNAWHLDNPNSSLDLFRVIVQNLVLGSVIFRVGDPHLLGDLEFRELIL